MRFSASLLASRETDAGTLFERARSWNRIAHMDGTRNRRMAYASKTEALIGAIRIHPERFRISGIEEGGWLLCVQCVRTRGSLHVDRADLEYRCPDWWKQQIEVLSGEEPKLPA